MRRGLGPLRWYPERWRRRYGDELTALLEDTYGPGRIPWRSQLGLARSGSAQRLRDWGVAGPARSPLAGSLLVLWAWAAFVVAGAGFVKLAEHWQDAVPAGRALLPTVGYDVTFCAGLAGAAIIAAAAVVCARPVRAFVADGRWREVSHLLWPAVALTVVSLSTVTAMGLWARHLSQYDRNGGSWPYGLLADVVALLITATIGWWAAVVTGTARRMELPAPVLRVCGGLAVALAVVMAVLVGGAVIWWGAIAARAPWFLGGTPPGTAGTVAPALLVLIGAIMVAGLAAGVIGAWRVVASFRRAPA
jgi:hypothetical protein